MIEAMPEDAGRFECVAINSAGEARCEADCQIQQTKRPTEPSAASPGAEKAPTIVKPLADQTVKEGQAVAFKCAVSAKPGISFCFYFTT